MCATLLLSSVLVSSWTHADDRALPPELPDQFGEMGGLQVQPAIEQLVIVVSAKRLRRLKPWERELREHYPDLRIVRVADVPVSGSADTEAVAAKLRKRLPDDVAVLMDLDGVWAKTFSLDPSVPNLLLFGAELELLMQHAGFYKRSEFSSFSQALDDALAATAQVPAPAP